MQHIEAKGARMPALGIGTFEVRGEACYEAVAHALSLGYRHVDTARMYRNEEEVGRAIADAGVSRGDVWLTTKVPPGDAAPDDLQRCAEGSLRRLRTDHVDLLLLHWPAPDVPLADTLGAMTELVEQGKARHIGVSNFTVALVDQATRIADILTNQVEYHPFLDQAPVLAAAEADEHCVTAYSPVAKGAVADDPTLQEIAAAHGKTPGQVALRWLLQQPRVAAIPRSSNPERRKENFDVFDFALSDDEVKAISGLARPDGRLVDPGFAPDWDT